MPFPNQVQTFPALAVAGDFASANPRASVLAGAGALVSGAAGVYVGRFAWISADGFTVSNGGGGAPNGFVHREQQGLITVFLAEAALLVPQGFPVTLHQEGDFWVKNDGTNTTVRGQKAYANTANGNISFNATGTPPVGASVTGGLTPLSGNFTGSISIIPGLTGPSQGVLAVTAVADGVLTPGAALSGAGVSPGTVLGAQLNGNATVGNWTVTPPQTVASETITEAYANLAVSAVGSGSVTVNDTISGTGVTVGSKVLGQLNGTPGGVGNYSVSPSQTAGNTTITVDTGVETKWICADTGRAPGELTRMTSWPEG